MDRNEEGVWTPEEEGCRGNPRVPPGDPRWTTWANLPVNVTRYRERRGAYCFETYLSWPAWARCGLHEEAYRELYDLCEALADALKSGPPGPVVRFRWRDADDRGGIDLEAAYGPDGRWSASVYVTTPGEPKWVKPRFDLGLVRVLPSAREHLPPEYVNAALGRHAAGDWGQPRVDNDRRAAARLAVESWYDLPTPGSFVRAGVVTDPSRTETTVCASLDL